MRPAHRRPTARLAPAAACFIAASMAGAGLAVGATSTDDTNTAGPCDPALSLEFENACDPAMSLPTNDPRVADALIALFGTRYAGTWVDRTGEAPVLVLAVKDLAPEDGQQFQALPIDTTRVRLEYATFSQAELKTVSDVVGHAMAPFTFTQLYGVEADRNLVGIDVPADKVTIVRSSTQKALAASRAPLMPSIRTRLAADGLRIDRLIQVRGT
jgi:hypothetical protein